MREVSSLPSIPPSLPGWERCALGLEHNWIAGMTQFFYVPDTQGKVSNNEREELVRELRRELGLGGGGGGGRGKSLQVAFFCWEKNGFSA